MKLLGDDFNENLLKQIVRGQSHGVQPGCKVRLRHFPALMILTTPQAVAMARRLLECAGVKPALECPGHERGGMLAPCCDRAGEYNGYGSDGPRTFTCPKGCSCHD